MAPRTIFIWDVHGCIDELRELMETLAPTSEDRVIFLGDIINRGPYPAEVAQYVYEREYECILGNHELHYSLHYETEGYRDRYSHLSPETHNWLVSLPSYIEWEDFIAVHGGIAPGLHPKDTDRGVTCKVRYWDTENACMGNKEHIPWHKLYTGTKKIIYGHWAAQWLTVQEKTVGLDSGCVFGGQLSAYVLETAEIIQVKAKQAYQEIEIK